MRPTVTVTKAVNLAQLDAELGGYGLTADGTVDDLATAEREVAISVVDGSPVTETDLAAAVEAHVPVWPPSRDEQIDAIVDAANDPIEAVRELAKARLLS